VTSLVLRDLQREKVNKKERKKYGKFRVQDFDQIHENVKKLNEMGDYMNNIAEKDYRYDTGSEDDENE